MLEALRRGTGTWIAKIFIGLLVLSFAVWGIADIFGGYGQRSVATVGETEIDAQDYQEALRRRLQSLRDQVGRTITMEEARQFGIDEQVFAEMLRQAALDNQGGTMNLGISDAAIAERIVREQAFHDATGNFDRNRFMQILQANGWSEGAFVARQRDNYVRQQLVQTVGQPVQPPKVLIEAANVYRNETRRLKYFTVAQDKVEPAGNPSSEDLQEYYESNKSSYAIPEMRKAGVIAMLPETAAKNIEIGNDDLKARYENTMQSFRQPERRKVRQISFPDEAAASEAHEKIQAGGSFEDIASERDLSEADTDLGLVEKSALADAAVAEAAFALEEGQVSEPVSGALNTVILKVEAIEPEKVTPFEEAKEEIREAMAEERSADVIHDMHNSIEDERASGAGLADVARTLGLEHRVIEAVDARGNGPDGEPVKDLPHRDALLRAIFESEPGIENDPLETENHGLVWYDVIEVIPSRIPDFDKVRDKVAADWRAKQERDRLAEKARDLVKAARGGESLESLARELGVEVVESEPLKRSDSTDALPRNVVAQAFAQPSDGYGLASADDRRKWVVFQVSSVEPPAAPTLEESAPLVEAFGQQFADDLVAQYVAGLVGRFGVSRNEAIFNQITGRGGEETDIR